MDFSAAVRLQLKPKQSQPLVDSVDSGLPVLALGEQQEELQEACLVAARAQPNNNNNLKSLPSLSSANQPRHRPHNHYSRAPLPAR